MRTLQRDKNRKKCGQIVAINAEDINDHQYGHIDNVDISINTFAYIVRVPKDGLVCGTYPIRFLLLL
jgi:hypothetical protein